MESPQSIANFFIGKSLTNSEEINLLKLVKLVYLSHAWHLALTDGIPLFNEGIFAWKYGPVVKSVLDTFRCGENTPITKISTYFNNDIKIPYMISDSKLIPFLDKIWELYGSRSGYDLSALCRMEGTPWDDINKRLGGYISTEVVIPNDLITEKYKEKLKVD